jgi:hypothetical protein
MEDWKVGRLEDWRSGVSFAVILSSDFRDNKNKDDYP